jgi:hypothetical protein
MPRRATYRGRDGAKKNEVASDERLAVQTAADTVRVAASETRDVAPSIPLVENPRSETLIDE